jgi:hypothetical protein
VENNVKLSSTPLKLESLGWFEAIPDAIVALISILYQEDGSPIIFESCFSWIQ